MGNGIETSNGYFVEVPNLPYRSHIFGITVSLPLQGGPNSFPGHTLYLDVTEIPHRLTKPL
ncbi:hypothetical protein [Methanosarcina siciliae]|uniref:hypothetical protein n=1 Tax=Methanosarcina siciliae TaxID=38027 RepID=UPI0018CD21C9|nr:hypothetical protein [Methanosarcina siciliae]